MAERKIGIIGLGYVGLSLVMSFANDVKVIGYDTNHRRVIDLNQHYDYHAIVDSAELESCEHQFTCDENGLKSVNFFVITVPTPIDENYTPDLTPLIAASRTVGKYLKPNDIVVYESTVYPGVTEEICLPELESVSGLKSNHDFFIGYSPERVNFGDKVRGVRDVAKVISAQNVKALDEIDAVYSSIIRAGTYRVSSIRVAEAVKVIENTERYVNITFLNEMMMTLSDLSIPCEEVMAAMHTKWNSPKLRPGLIGGHCIGVDPFYLNYLANRRGIIAQSIITCEQINLRLYQYIASEIIKALIQAGCIIRQSKVVILGLAFKENITDIRNSGVYHVYQALKSYSESLEVLVFDPLVSIDDAYAQYHIKLVEKESLSNLDALVLLVPHRAFQAITGAQIKKMLSKHGFVIDFKGFYDVAAMRAAGVTIVAI